MANRQDFRKFVRVAKTKAERAQYHESSPHNQAIAAITLHSLAYDPEATDEEKRKQRNAEKRKRAARR